MNASRSKRTVQNMTIGFIYQAMSVVLSFISRTVFIRTLGAEYLGLNGIFSDVLTLLSMADLGFSTAMAYTFYKPLAEDDHETIAALIGFYRKVYNVIAAAVTVLGLCCVPFLRYIVNTKEDIPNLEIYYLFSLISVVTSYLFVYKTTLLTADQKDFKVVSVRMVTTFMKSVFQIVILLLWKNYILYLAIGTFFALLNNFIASAKAEKEYPYIRNIEKKIGIGSEIKKNIVSNMKSVFIYKFSTTMFNATDNIIISMVVSTAAVGLYSNYLMISNKLLLVEQIIFSSMTAGIGNVIARESTEKRFTVFKSMQSLSYIFCGILTSVFCVMINDIICVWLGEDYLLSFKLVIAVSLNTYLGSALLPLWIYRDATGLYQKTKYIMLIAAIENIVLSVVMGKMIGVAGVIFASAIARLTTSCWYEPKVLYKEYFDMNVSGYYMGLLRNAAFSMLVTAIIYLIAVRFPVNTWYELIVKGIAVGTICSIIFVLAYFKTEGAQNIIQKIKSLLQKHKR